MKLVGIAGTVEEVSYNKKLMQFMSNHFAPQVDIEILPIEGIPMFEMDNDQTESQAVQYLARKIAAADGVIIATPEHNHTITAALKSVIEWLSYKVHPFTDKPVMIVGASYYTQGSSRAQLNLRQILESPGVNAIVMPGNEFLLANVKEAFDENGNLKDSKTTDFLATTLRKFMSFVKVINTMNDVPASTEAAAQEEDMKAGHPIKTTVKDVDMHADDWVEQAAAKTNAVEGDTYVKLDRGLLTVDQLNWFLNTVPIELTFADDNNQFIYYNKGQAPDGKMLAPRKPSQAGDPLEDVHPARALPGAKRVVHALRTGTDYVKMPVPGWNDNKFIVHYYKRMEDYDGNYAGVNESVYDLMPDIKWYLKKTGQMLVKDPNAADVGAGASEDSNAGGGSADAGAGASEDEAPAAPSAPATPAPAADTGAGASES